MSVQVIGSKEKVLYGFLILAMILAWLSVIDSAAYELNIQSLKETSGAFVVLKLFDSLITLAQDFPVIGSMFSPYKDFLDNMSFIMLISFLSLGLQKVIIVAMQSFIVNAILSINVLVVVANGFKQFLSAETAKKLLKLAVLLVFIRFAIPVMTFVVVSIQAETDVMSSKMHQERVDRLEAKLLNLNELITESEEQKEQKERNLVLLNEKLVVLIDSKDAKEDEITVVKNKNNGAIVGAFSRATSYISGSKEDAETQAKLEPLEADLKSIEAQIKLLENKIDDAEGGSMFSMDVVKNKIKIAMENLNTFIEDMIDLFLTSVIMFFFTNVFFPLIFLWALFRLIDRSFNTDYSNKLNTAFERKGIIENNAVGLNK